MAARRKSAKPTNKLRHQLQIEDDEEEDMDESTLPRVSIPTSRDSPQRNLLSQTPPQNKRTQWNTSSLFDQTSLPRQYLTLAQASESHIAIPSEIYQDFEALKSATNLDTTELMRKLLTDYQKITSSSQSPRERKLDAVIGDLFASRSLNVLDLSKRAGTITSSAEQDCNSIIGQGYTDDQLAMGILDKMEAMDESVDLKPLDLTLHKHQPHTKVDPTTAAEFISLKRHLTPALFPPFFKSSATSNDDGQCPESFKQAGSYVINLEPGSDNPSFANSSLAQVLRMDIPLHNFSKGDKYTTKSQEPLFLRDGEITPPTPRKTTSDGNVQHSQGGVHIRSKLFQNDKETSTLFKIPNHETTPAVSSCLPSYAEAVTSVLNSQQSKRTFGGLSNEPVAVQIVNKAVQDCQSSTVSLVHINAEDADIKFVPLNLNSQLVATSSSSDDHPNQQHNLLQQLLQHHLMSENKSLQQQQLQSTSASQINPFSNPLNTFCNGQISHIQMMQVPGIKSDLSDIQGMTQAIKSNEVSYPNFLLESHAVGIPSIPTGLSSVTLASTTLPNTTMSMPTFFMTTSTNGGMGHMVAIPVIHAVPDGVTGLQPFAFAPHPMSLPSNGSSVLRGSTDMISASSSIVPADILSSSKHPDESRNTEQMCSTPFTSEDNPPPHMEATKSKPGRPRGRGSRGQSQKTQSKDMKLLTENTLFPGVYTSILKLPWSRRSRNKTKAKTISEIKKQDNIIDQTAVNEGDKNLMQQGIYKEEVTEHEETNCFNLTDQTRIQNTTEERVENQQDQTDHNQRHQIQQQKLKDLEQQQRLHLQYHLRLQEEQQKLTKQIEQSYLHMGTDSPVPIPFVVSNEQMLLGKQDLQNIENLQKECPGLAVSVGPCDAPDSITFTQPLLSKEPVMMVYCNTDLSAPKKSPRKRGRPPKVPNVNSKTTDGHFTLSTASMVGSVEHYEMDNFLHTNIPVSNYTTSISDTKSHCSLSVFPQHLLASETEDQTSLSATKSSDDSEMTLEKKIHFLTNKIGLELSHSMAAHSTGVSKGKNSQSVKPDPENENHEDTMYQEMRLAMSKSLVDVKPRRKKVSRLLKSDENFMYATFKIKPKGLTPRKSRRRRKDVLASTSVVAESIANLRQKNLQDSVTACSDADSCKPPSMVAWKFHEQYPCSNEEDETKDIRTVCIKCGNCLSYESEDLPSGQCETCLLNGTELQTCIDRNEIILNHISQIKMEDTEMKAECCVTCGDVFQKHFSDPSARCDACRNSTPGVIKSSKLFSFHDSPTDATVLRSSTSKPPTTVTFLTVSDSSLKDRKFSEKSLTKMNNNHLFCSLCRMEFTKICDYLSHTREMHEIKLEDKAQMLSVPTDLNRKPKLSKTKKSLAHKTLTCPVEECPHFFREQNDLDLHFMKIHSNMGTCSHGDAYTPPDDLDHTLQLDHFAATTAPSNGLTSSTSEILSSTEKAGCAAVICEKPLQCEFCDYRCRQKNALTWHMRKHPEAASQYRKYSNLNAD